jgi:hypothetical protein
VTLADAICHVSLIGQVAEMGTGLCQVTLDLDLLRDVQPDAQGDLARWQLQQGGAMTPGGGYAAMMTPYDDADVAFNDVGRIFDAAFRYVKPRVGHQH